MIEVYSREELLEKKPKGEVFIREVLNGDVFKTFVCHGCQTCLHFTDDECTKIDQHYPHFIAPFTKVEPGAEPVTPAENKEP